MGANFLGFHRFPSRRINLAVRHIDVILTTLLSIASRRCRPTASSVWMLPLFQRRNSASWSPTHPSQVPRLGTCPILVDRPFHLSADGFSRSVFRVQPAGFHLADLRAIRGPKANISLLPALCTEVMHTPASLARQCLLSAYHPTSGLPVLLSVLGWTDRGRYLAPSINFPGKSPDEAASSRTPAQCWAIFRLSRG